MIPDIDIPDVSVPDYILGGELAGLEIYQCEHWGLDEYHGGVISSTRIYDGKDAIFGRVTKEQNESGVTHYYKTHWKNGSGDSWPDVVAIVSVNASGSFPRESVSVSIGTASDDMSDKPNDSTFSYMSAKVSGLAPGDAISLWIRQIVSGGDTNAERGQDVTISIILQEA